jgi:hypothetical protein
MVGPLYKDTGKTPEEKRTQRKAMKRKQKEMRRATLS